MLKKIIFSICLISSNCVFSQIINGSITYKATVDYSNIIEELKDSTNYSLEDKKMIYKKVELASDLNFKLLFNENESLFYCESENKSENLTGILSDSKSTYYTNLKSNDSFKLNKSFSQDKIPSDSLKWKFLNETKKIGNYICHKGIATIVVKSSRGLMKRSIVAWYTSEVPIQFGLQNLNGLPGLIMELNIDNKKFKLTFTVIKIQLNPIEEIIIDRPI